MSNPVDKFKDFSSIVENVDVSDIVTSLAKGIAEAQVLLDNNSIQQTIALADKKIGGKSLIEHGFVPAFYSFEYADVSASINLTMRQSSEFEIGGSAEFDNYRKQGYSKDTTTEIEKEREDKSRREYRSSNDVVIKSSSSRHVKVEGQRYKLDQTEGSISMIEKFEKALETSSTIERVYHQQVTEQAALSVTTATNASIIEKNGFIIIGFPEIKTVDWGLLRLTDYAVPTTIDLSSTIDFAVNSNGFADTAAAATTAIGGNLIDQYDFPQDKDDVSVYFDFNKHETIDYTYKETTYGNTAAINPDLELQLKIIAYILEYDDNAKITVTGHTDRSGGATYNKDKLSKWRANTVKSTIESFANVRSGQIVVDHQGETLADQEESGDTTVGTAADLAEPRNPKYRRVDISFSFDADYIFFIGTDFSDTDAKPIPTATAPNRFLKVGGKITNPTANLVFDYIGGTYTINATSASNTTISDLFAAITSDTKVQNNFIHETKGSLLYLLHNETKIKFTALSTSSDTISIEEDVASSDSEKSYREDVEVYESINKSKYLKQSTESLENPGFIAFSAGIDARYEQQFSIDMSANASVAARMKSVPPPAKFITFIKAELGIDLTPTSSNSGSGSSGTN